MFFQVKTDTEEMENLFLLCLIGVSTEDRSEHDGDDGANDVKRLK